VQVDAYPQRPFRGMVEKIEPQAVVQQSVTMFPVLVSISNEDGVLLPGMNGEVTVVVDQRNDAVAVPLDAVRTVRELPAVAKALGLNADSLQTALRALREGARGGAGGDSVRVAARGGAGGAGGDSTARGQGRRRGTRAGRGGAAGAMGGSGARSAVQTMIAMAKTEKGMELRIVRVGLSDFDYGEVLSGLKEGDQVAMLSVAQIQAQRAENINQIRERVSGMGGLGGGTGGARGGQSGGQGGGGQRRSGGPGGN